MSSIIPNTMINSSEKEMLLVGFFFPIYLACMCICVCGRGEGKGEGEDGKEKERDRQTQGVARYMWRSGDSWQPSVLSVHQQFPGTELQMSDLAVGTFAC